MSDLLRVLIEDQTHIVKSTRMAFGRKPVHIMGPDEKGVMVLHVTGSQMSDGTYVPAHFIVLRVEYTDTRAYDGHTDYECSIIVTIPGVPKKPSKRRRETPEQIQAQFERDGFPVDTDNDCAP